jgi:hypothetical protein
MGDTKMGEVYVVTSGKGGVGKTTTTANIGAALAMEGNSVVLLDADIGLRNLDVVLGLENRIVYDLIDVVEGACRLKQALVKDKRFDGLFLLPAAQTRDKDAVSPKQMQDEWLELVTVHELAHQWWYGLVGNDEVHDSWLDEGLTEYSTILYYGRRYGREEAEHKYQIYINKGKFQLFRIYRDGGDTNETIHRPLYEFKDWLEYDSLVYGKGAIMFHELRQEMGDETFFKVLREYFENNKYRNAKPKDLYKACQEVSGKSWEDFFLQWLYDDYEEKAG